MTGRLLRTMRSEQDIGRRRRLAKNAEEELALLDKELRTALVEAERLRTCVEGDAAWRKESDRIWEETQAMSDEELRAELQSANIDPDEFDRTSNVLVKIALKLNRASADLLREIAEHCRANNIIIKED